MCVAGTVSFWKVDHAQHTAQHHGVIMVCDVLTPWPITENNLSLKFDSSYLEACHNYWFTEVLTLKICIFKHYQSSGWLWKLIQKL